MLSGRSGAHGATAPEGLAQRDGTPARVRSCGGHTERRLAGRAEQTRNAKTSRSGSILAATQWRRTRRHWGCRTDLDKGESTSGPAMPAIYRLGTYPDEAIRVLTQIVATHAPHSPKSPSRRPMRLFPHRIRRGWSQRTALRMEPALRAPLAPTACFGSRDLRSWISGSTSGFANRGSLALDSVQPLAHHSRPATNGPVAARGSFWQLAAYRTPLPARSKLGSDG